MTTPLLPSGLKPAPLAVLSSLSFPVMASLGVWWRVRLWVKKGRCWWTLGVASTFSTNLTYSRGRCAARLPSPSLVRRPMVGCLQWVGQVWLWVTLVGRIVFSPLGKLYIPVTPIPICSPLHRFSTVNQPCVTRHRMSPRRQLKPCSTSTTAHHHIVGLVAVSVCTCVWLVYVVDDAKTSHHYSSLPVLLLMMLFWSCFWGECYVCLNVCRGCLFERGEWCLKWWWYVFETMFIILSFSNFPYSW